MATTNSGTTASETFGTTSAVTGSAPSVSTDGQPLHDLESIQLVVAVGSGVTLSGAGTLDCYVYDPSVALWTRLPSGDFSLVGIPASLRTYAFAPVTVTVKRSARLKWVPTGVTFSAGSAGVTLYQLGYSKKIRY